MNYNSFLNTGIQHNIPRVFHPYYSFFKKIAANAFLRISLRAYRAKPKILYMLAPPPYLRNLGDHAQVLGINKWLKEEFSESCILRFDKAQTQLYLSAIGGILNPSDIILLQSGGNMGDRGLWTEYLRRRVVEKFPRNKIISLPQTIYFSNTEKGCKELQISKSIYNKHFDLTIMARDEKSFELALNYFPSCRIRLCPDFVLNLDCPVVNNEKRNGILICFRNDPEASLGTKKRESIIEMAKRKAANIHEWDTNTESDILPEKRIQFIQSALRFVSSHRVVITDRLHATIFAVITKTPCVALKSADHKLEESYKWFHELNYTRFAGDDVEKAGRFLEEMMRVKKCRSIDWSERYFSGLKKELL
jgi:exopolysaccharide biosynthesis predicted pyruvyltransferase EpsI